MKQKCNVTPARYIFQEDEGTPSASQARGASPQQDDVRWRALSCSEIATSSPQYSSPGRRSVKQDLTQVTVSLDCS
jgi:hypothetical protein